MAERSVSLRLGTTGKAEVKSDLQDIGSTGEQQINRWSKASEKASRDIDEAIAAKARAEMKLSAVLPQTPTQQAYQAGASTNYDGPSARDSAAAMKELLAQEEALDERARLLTAVLEPLRAAQDKYNAEVRNAAELHDAGRISIEKFIAAEQRAAEALQRVSGESKSQDETAASLSASSRYAADPDTAMVGKSARDSAEAMQELLTREEQRAAQAQKLRETLDPLIGAQQRYDAELKKYQDLLDSGHITTDVHRQAVEKAGKAYLDAADNTRKLGDSNAFTYTQMQMMKSAAFNSYQSLAAGMPIMRVLAEQGVEVVQAFVGEGGVSGALKQTGDASQAASSAIGGSGGTSSVLDELRAKAAESAKALAEEHGVSGALSKVMSILTPTRLIMAGTAVAVIAGTKAWFDYASSVAKLTALAQGMGVQLGESGAQLEANAESAADAAKISVAAARDLEQAYISIAASGDVLVGLTAITRDFAAATGQDAKGAQQELATAFGDTITGAQQMAEKYGAVTQAQMDHIAKLVEEGDQTNAQIALLNALGPAFDGAAAHANVLERGWSGIATAASDAWTWMGKALDRLATGGALNDQIKALETQRDSTPAAFSNDRAAIQSQIDALRVKLNQETAAASRRAEVSNVAQGKSIVDSYTGASVLAGYRNAAGKLQAALGTQSQLDPQQRAAMTDALSAYTHAIDTFIPSQEKANQLAQIDAKIAATKSPAAKAALAAQREQVAAAGQVITAANVSTLAHAKADAAAAHATHTNDNHAKSLARQAESMKVAARASLDLAQAYLTSDSAAIDAEARRKAVTDATRKGIDVDAQMQRERALMIAEQIANSAKSVAALRGENDARTSVDEQVASGTLDVKDMSRALADEAALRPLLALRAIAQGDALRVLNQVLTDYRAQLAKAHDAESQEFALKGIDEAQRKVEDLRAAIADLGKPEAQQALDAAHRTAVRSADDNHLTGQTRTNYLGSQDAVAAADGDANRAKYVADTARAMQDQIAMSQTELGLVGANDNVREGTLAKERLILDLKQRMIPVDSDQGQLLLAQQDQYEAIVTQLRKQQDTWDEIKQTGGEFLDDLANPDGSGIKNLLSDIEAQFIKLAAIAPLKNLLFGEKNTTLTDVFGSLFGGGSGIKNPTVDLSWLTPHNATGSQNFSGGLTWVNENGPEIADLPNGTRIYPAGETRRMMQAANDQGGGVSQHFYLDGAVVDQTLYQKMAAIGDAAAVRGAAGGAAISATQSRAAGTRRLGRWR